MKLHLYFCSSYLAQKPLCKRCAALIAPYVFRQFAGAVLLSAMPRHQGNKRGELRPEFFIMPPFQIAGPGFGVLMAGYVIRQIIRIEKRLCILWNSCAQVNCAVPAI